MSTYAYRQAAGLRQALLDRRELALIDVREEADFATAHPLFAVNLPLSKLELEVRRRIPRFTTPLTVYDNGEGLAEIAVERLRSWGYQDVALLAEGLAGWRRSGGELFQDVNSASKAFGELVESVHHTPSLSAQEVQALIDSRQEVVIVDARRFDEYQTMSIPGSISVPGGELVLRVDSLTPSPQTPIIVTEKKRIAITNREARDLLCSHIVGQDVRMALRQPEAVRLLEERAEHVEEVALDLDVAAHVGLTERQFGRLQEFRLRDVLVHDHRELRLALTDRVHLVVQLHIEAVLVEVVEIMKQEIVHEFLEMHEKDSFLS